MLSKTLIRKCSELAPKMSMHFTWGTWYHQERKKSERFESEVRIFVYELRGSVEGRNNTEAFKLFAELIKKSRQRKKPPQKQLAEEPFAEVK